MSSPPAPNRLKRLPLPSPSIFPREPSRLVKFLKRYIGQYLPLLQFPQHVTDALTEGEINLHEASRLTSLTPERLVCTPARAKSARAEMLRAHLLSHGSQNSLRTRVKEILGGLVSVSTEQMANVV